MVALTLVVGVAGATISVAAQETGNESLDLTVESGEVQAGENVTVTFTLENTGSQDTGAILNVTASPSEWTVTGHDDADGLWRSDQKWLFQTVPAGESVSPSITYQVPENASGEITIAATAMSGDQSVQDEVTLDVQSGADDSSSIPGFGVTGAVIALMAVALLARRR